MRCLFISANLLNSKNGGWQCSNRNLESIKELSAHVEVFYIEPNNMQNKFAGLLRLLKFYSGGLTNVHICQVLEKIKSGTYNKVFVDSSVLGKLVKSIKRNYPHIDIISFYHNIEFDFIYNIVLTGGLSHLLRLPACFYNEYVTAKWSDRLIFLTNADAEMAARYYHVKNASVIPISFKKVKFELPVTQKSNSKKINLLFVGSYFYANIQGIKWFLQHVCLNEKLKLTIVGREMGKLQQDIKIPHNVEICENVDDIGVYYHNAHAVICPLFVGGGMKVKVAEALMFGKKIIGSTHAFLGYNAELCSNMVQTDEAAVFKNSIEQLDPSKKFYVESVMYFDKYFSYTTTLKQFETVLKAG